MKEANHQVCRCNKPNKIDIVYLNTIPIDNELESLDQFYCKDCNSFWNEP